MREGANLTRAQYDEELEAPRDRSLLVAVRDQAGRPVSPLEIPVPKRFRLDEDLLEVQR